MPNTHAMPLGGFSLGEKLYWIGLSEPDRRSRDRLVHGAVCKVMGPSSTGKPDHILVLLQFPGNDVRIDCKLTNLSRSPPPPLPGGFSLSEMVYYLGLTWPGKQATGSCTVIVAKSWGQQTLTARRYPCSSLETSTCTPADPVS